MDFLRFALRYAYSRRKQAAYLLFWCAVYILVLLVWKLPVISLLYLMVVSLTPVLYFEARHMLYACQKHLTLNEVPEISEKTLDELAELYPPKESLDDNDYQTLLRRALEENVSRDDDSAESVGLTEYYSRWAKEIKAPVGAMERILLTGDSPLVRRMSVEVRHLEQYAEMAVVYARLESGPKYALKRYDLSALIQRSIQKFSAEAMEKKLYVNFDPVPRMVVTDGKWFSFALEQILSNALKYTFSGGVTIAIEKDANTPEELEDWENVSDGKATGIGPVLSVRDTGMGVPADKMEGLLDWEAAADDGDAPGGLGLYLCRRICEGLGHSITVLSKEGAGTCVRLELSVGLGALATGDREDDNDADDMKDAEPVAAGQ